MSESSGFNDLDTGLRQYDELFRVSLTVGTRMATETELKLAIDVIDLKEIGEHPEVLAHAVGVPVLQPMKNTYFDTPEQLLHRKGIALRLRHNGKHWLQTVKTGGSGTVGLHNRGEWEMPVRMDKLEPERFKTLRLRKLFRDARVRNRLVPLFNTDFMRTVWTLVYPDDCRIELAFDQGEIRSGQASETISEIELELIEGEAADLFATARALAESLPVRLFNTSKAERGYRLEHAPPVIVASKAASLKAGRKSSAEQVFVEIMRKGLDQLQANEQVLLNNPEDTEGVHQMRVATRRMRSCLRLYRPLIPSGISADLNRRIKGVTDTLGPCRDWDVFLDETLIPLSAAFPGDHSLEALLEVCEQQRTAAYRVATSSVRSREHTCLLLDLVLWLELRSWREGMKKRQRAALDQPVRHFSRNTLTRCHRKVVLKGQRFSQLDAEQRHNLRIHCKRLRYAADFFSGFFDSGPARKYTRSLARVQDVLGVLNDSHMVEQLLEKVHEDARTTHAKDLVRGWTAAGVRSHLEQFDTAWKAFVARPPFWGSVHL